MEDEIKTEEKVESTTEKITSNEVQKIDLDSNLIKADNTSLSVSLDKTKSVSEQAEDLVDLAATAKAVQDEKLVQDITNLKKEELKTHAETKTKEKTAASKEADIKLQAANYGVYAGIAELIGLKKPLPEKMLNILMIILMPLLIVYYTAFGIITGIVNITMDCVNSVVIRFAEFTKPAKKVILFVALLFLLGVIGLVIRAILIKCGVIN